MLPEPVRVERVRIVWGAAATSEPAVLLVAVSVNLPRLVAVVEL
jgi:hypothetical protein